MSPIVSNSLNASAALLMLAAALAPTAPAASTTEGLRGAFSRGGVPATPAPMADRRLETSDLQAAFDRGGVPATPKPMQEARR